MRTIPDPAALRRMRADELPALADEIRAFLIEKVCATGGHLGVNLGVVELSIALHRVFASPHDTILYDTGHQSYVHKILTGRQSGFTRLRQRDGLSGYPSRTESVHDHIENSHASTVLAYADGLAKARGLSGQANRAIVAVIGDGALTGGLAWEGLNNLSAAPARPVIVVLNDNGRSYAPTIGGIAAHLSALRRKQPGTLFEQLGFAYLGPIDGHDIGACERALRAARLLACPVVVHCVTQKGYGYRPAEADEAELMHAVPVINAATGEADRPAPPTWTDVFSDELVAIGRRRDDVVAITAAMPGPTGLMAFAAEFPHRYFDVGIAEQHAICSAAGLAMGGLHPVVAVYATFLGRALDQVMMDVALHRLPVTMVCDRAGITGPDGPSHHGMWDLAMLSAVPGLRVAAPRDPARLRELLGEAVAIDGPTLVRYPKATAGDDLEAAARMSGMDILFRGRRLPLDVLLVSIGALAGECLRAAVELTRLGIGTTVVDPRWVIPAHPDLPHLAARHRLTVTVEDGNRVGGAGTLIAQACADASVATPVRNLGLPGRFIEPGSRAELLAARGLTGPAIAREVMAALDQYPLHVGERAP